jgi:hypothetical protein
MIFNIVKSYIMIKCYKFIIDPIMHYYLFL